MYFLSGLVLGLDLGPVEVDPECLGLDLNVDLGSVGEDLEGPEPVHVVALGVVGRLRLQ